MYRIIPSLYLLLVSDFMQPEGLVLNVCKYKVSYRGPPLYIHDLLNGWWDMDATKPSTTIKLASKYSDKTRLVINHLVRNVKHFYP